VSSVDQSVCLETACFFARDYSTQGGHAESGHVHGERKRISDAAAIGAILFLYPKQLPGTLLPFHWGPGRNYFRLETFRVPFLLRGAQKFC